MPTEYANSEQCRAAGVEPVPQVGDEVKHRSHGLGFVRAISNNPTWGMTVVVGLGEDEKEYLWCFARQRTSLIRRGDVTIPEHSDTPEGEK